MSETWTNERNTCPCCGGRTTDYEYHCAACRGASPADDRWTAIPKPLRDAADLLTRNVTAFPSFAALATDCCSKGYRPTLNWKDDMARKLGLMLLALLNVTPFWVKTGGKGWNHQRVANLTRSRVLEWLRECRGEPIEAEVI